METIQILQKCFVVGNVIKLPEIQLDHKLEYTPIKRQIEAAGGKWNTRSQGFLFEEDPTELLASLQSGTQINTKKEFQFYPTPSILAGYLVTLAYNNHLVNIINPLILEPSAGDGAIVKAITKKLPDVRVDCCELMELNRIKLQKVPGVDIIGNDFLEAVENDTMNLFNCQYDAVIANPPFSKNQDIDHIRAMYKCLKPGGILVSIASQSWFNGSQKKQEDFKDWLKSINAHIEQIQPGQFKESGTMVGGTIIIIKKQSVKTEPLPEFETLTNTSDEMKELSELLEEPEIIIEKITQSLSEAKSKINNISRILKNEEMEFFKQVSDLIGQSEMSFTIKAKDDKLTVMILPRSTTKETSGISIKPLILTGTPSELDELFFAEIYGPIEKAVGLITNLESFEKSLEPAGKPEEQKTVKKNRAKSDVKKEGTTDASEETETEEEKEVKAELLRKKEEAEAAEKLKTDNLNKFNELIKSANEFEEVKNYTEAIKLLKEAKELSEDPELVTVKIKELIGKRIELEMEEA